MQSQKQRHGRTEYYIAGEEAATFGTTSPLARAAMVTSPCGQATNDATTPPADPNRAFRFCRLFPNLPPFQPGDDRLVDLGKAMVDDRDTAGADSSLPSGYTYFGQFVDHDITFDRTAGIPDGQLDPGEIIQGRSPSLELDSLYGRGPTNSPELYEPDGIHLRLGLTTGRIDFGVTAAFPNDLPRRPANDPTSPQQAIIGDPRNDENLAVAQTHVAFLKFHNRVTDVLSAAGTNACELFDLARKTVIQHYQSIVLHDLVRRLVAPSVFNDVLTNNRRCFFPGHSPQQNELCIPIEFSVAAYRLGHSLIRNNYQWNRVFNSAGTTVADLGLLFTFSQGSGNLGGEPTLPSDWIVDWRRMYDFSERPGGVRHPQQNFARPLDTHLARELRNLPEFVNTSPQHLKFLSVRNLLRGRLLGLPSGQAVALELGVAPLTPTEVASGSQAALIANLEFDQQTPLWFYILKEAEVRHAGQHLGEVGSRIVAETLHGLIAGSEFSILSEPNWQPTLASLHPRHFTMIDLLLFVDDVNPIGD